MSKFLKENPSLLRTIAIAAGAALALGIAGAAIAKNRAAAA